jgi:hypothetical protein
VEDQFILRLPVDDELTERIRKMVRERQEPPDDLKVVWLGEFNVPLGQVAGTSLTCRIFHRQSPGLVPNRYRKPQGATGRPSLYHRVSKVSGP